MHCICLKIFKRKSPAFYIIIPRTGENQEFFEYFLTKKYVLWQKVFYITKLISQHLREISAEPQRGDVLLGAKSTKNAGVPIPPHPWNGLAGAQCFSDVVFFNLRFFVFETTLPLRHLNALINLLSGIYKFCPPAKENDADRILPVDFVVSKTGVSEFNHR